MATDVDCRNGLNNSAMRAGCMLEFDCRSSIVGLRLWLQESRAEICAHCCAFAVPPVVACSFYFGYHSSNRTSMPVPSNPF
jgi:hypothetical protein